MGRKRKRSAAVEEKRKAVKVRPIERKHAGKVVEPYRIMEAVVKDHHTGEVNGVKRNLDQAKFILLWHKGWKPDVDKVLTLAKIKKATDADRAIGSSFGDTYDFVMQLNEAAWPGLSDEKKRQIIDHELCHAAPDLDRDGQQKLDSKERLCWRTRKHPIQEFPEIIERYGVDECLKLNEQARQAVEDAERPLLAATEKGGQAGKDPTKRPKRVKLTHDCEGLAEKGEEGTEFEVVKVEPDQLAVPGPDGVAYWLRADDYEVVEWEPVDWQTLPVTVLKLSDSVLEKMGAKDVLTLGDFQQFQAKHGDFWSKELGLRGKQAENVNDRYVAFWAEHKEYCPEPAKETPSA